jgi:hypothetical protein
MNITFTPTSEIRNWTITEGKVYEVCIDGSFWGWVAGENRSYVAMSQTQYAWSGGTKRTKAQAVAAARKAEGESIARELAVALHVPTYTREVRLTADNLSETDLTGWTISGGEDLGPVSNVRLTHDGLDNASITGDDGRDVLGLPCTITVYRD